MPHLAQLSLRGFTPWSPARRPPSCRLVAVGRGDLFPTAGVSPQRVFRGLLSGTEKRVAKGLSCTPLYRIRPGLKVDRQ